MQDLKSRVAALMRKNQRQHEGYQYTVPSPELYPFQWLWDSCFHAFIYNALGDHEAATRELYSVCARPLENGMLPHIIYWQDPQSIEKWGREKRSDVLDAAWGVAGTSALTQPPVIAEAVYETYLHTKDEQFKETLYPILANHFSYLDAVRSYKDTGLLFIVNPDESGEDNSPRFDAALDLIPTHSIDEHLDKRSALIAQNATCGFDSRDCMHDHFAFVETGFNTIYHQDLIAMSKLAHAHGKTEEADRYVARAEQVADSLRSFLYRDGWYTSYDIKHDAYTTVPTWNLLMPLYAGVLEQKEADELIKTYLQSEDFFVAPMGIPTVAKSDPAYDPADGFWRGPVWIAPHWFICKGLRCYGYDALATDLAQKTQTLIAQSGFREQYHPATGEGHGAHDFTWGGLVLTM